MFHQFRAAPTLLLPAVFLLCCFPAIGQTNSDRDRTLSINTNSARRDRSRSGTGAVQAKVNTKLPFEESVIIYYKVPGKTSADSAVTESQVPKRNSPTGLSSAAKVPTAARTPLRVENVPDLQPVIIYYGASRPAMAMSKPEQGSINASVKPAALARNESGVIARPVPKQATQFAARSEPVASGLTRIEEQKLTDVNRMVRNDVPPPNLNASSTGRVTDGPKQTRSVPMVNSASTGRVVAMTSEVETSDLTFERPVGKPIAPSDVAVSSMMPTTATTTEEATSGSLPASETGSVDAVELNNSAVHLTQEHKFAEAQALLERAIQAEPTTAKYHRNLSVLFERMKKFDEALASARTAEKLAPNDPTVLDQLCLLELVAGNNAAIAVGCFEKLKSIEPLDDMSQAHYGLALFRTGKEKESIAILEQVARSTPANADAMHVLGVVYYQRKRFDDAAEALKTAVETAPDRLEIRFNLAVVQLARRNRAAAISQYNIIKAGDAKLADQLYRMLNSDNVLSVSDMKRPKR